jgi:hypothetical protein
VVNAPAEPQHADVLLEAHRIRTKRDDDQFDTVRSRAPSRRREALARHPVERLVRFGTLTGRGTGWTEYQCHARARTSVGR